MTDDLKFPPEWEEGGQLAHVPVGEEEEISNSQIVSGRMKTDDGTSPDVKMDQLVHWEKHVGFQMGNPHIHEDVQRMLQTVLGRTRRRPQRSDSESPGTSSGEKTLGKI